MVRGVDSPGRDPSSAGSWAMSCPGLSFPICRRWGLVCSHAPLHADGEGTAAWRLPAARPSLNKAQFIDRSPPGTRGWHCSPPHSPPGWSHECQQVLRVERRGCASSGCIVD